MPEFLLGFMTGLFVMHTLYIFADHITEKQENRKDNNEDTKEIHQDC